jgi:hypothetical protein
MASFKTPQGRRSTHRQFNDLRNEGSPGKANSGRPMTDFVFKFAARVPALTRKLSGGCEIARPIPYISAPRSNRPRAAVSGFQRSPSLATRRGTSSTVKSSIRIPFSTSLHVTGVDTVASGRGRGE